MAEGAFLMWRQEGGLVALSSAPHLWRQNVQLPPQGYEHSIKHRKAAATHELTAASINPPAEHHTQVLQMGPATSSLSAHPRRALLSPRARDWGCFHAGFQPTVWESCRAECQSFCPCTSMIYRHCHHLGTPMQQPLCPRTVGWRRRDASTTAKQECCCSLFPLLKLRLNRQENALPGCPAWEEKNAGKGQKQRQPSSM